MPKAQSVPKAYDKILALQCYPEVLLKLKNGVAPEVIAEWVRGTKGEYLDVKEDTVVRQLYRFRGSLNAAELVENKPLFIQTAIEKMARNINEINELEKLYNLQVLRLSAHYEVESRLKVPMKQMEREVRLCAELLERLMDAKFKIGILKDVSKRAPGAPEAPVSPLPGEMTREQRERVGKAAQGILGAIRDQMAKPTTPGTVAGEETVVEAVDVELVPNSL